MMTDVLLMIFVSGVILLAVGIDLGEVIAWYAALSAEDRT